MNKAEESRDVRTMLAAARELRPWLELLGKLSDGSRSPSAAPGPATDRHQLATEAERYLGWYRGHIAGEPGDFEASRRRRGAAYRDPDRVFVLEDPGEGPTSPESSA